MNSKKFVKAVALLGVIAIVLSAILPLFNALLS